MKLLRALTERRRWNMWPNFPFESTTISSYLTCSTSQIPFCKFLSHVEIHFLKKMLIMSLFSLLEKVLGFEMWRLKNMSTSLSLLMKLQNITLVKDMQYKMLSPGKYYNQKSIVLGLIVYNHFIFQNLDVVWKDITNTCHIELISTSWLTGTCF